MCYSYFYKEIPHPWLQVKCLEILKFLKPPTDISTITKINDVLSNILAHTPVTKNVNKNNASHAILFEAMKLIIIYKDIVNKVLKSQSIALLEMFITVKEPNIRYLALECVASFSHLPYSEIIIVD